VRVNGKSLCGSPRGDYFAKCHLRDPVGLPNAGSDFPSQTDPITWSTHTELGYNSKVEGEVIVSRADAVINWIRTNSMWPMPMGLACCAIELMAVGGARFDIARFGAEVMRFPPGSPTA
jgi:hypothetical protein